jgi:hypothetical protein
MKVENYIEYAFVLVSKKIKGLAGLSCAESMMHLCELQDMLIWNGPEPQVGNWGPSTQSLFCLLLAKREWMWTTC